MKRTATIAGISAAIALAIGACSQGAEGEFSEKWDDSGPHVISEDDAFGAVNKFCDNMDNGDDAETATIGAAFSIVGDYSDVNDDSFGDDFASALMKGVPIVCKTHMDEIKDAAANDV